MLAGKYCVSLGYLVGSGRGLEERMWKPRGGFLNLKVDLPAKIMTNEKKDASGAWAQNQGGKSRELGRNHGADTTQHTSSPSILLEEPSTVQVSTQPRLWVHCDWSKPITMPHPSCQQLN